VTSREEVEPAVARARAAHGTVVIDFRVEQEDAVYPMVPAGAALDDMIRRPSPIVETATDVEWDGSAAAHGTSTERSGHTPAHRKDDGR
jgi:hypothetical protein